MRAHTLLLGVAVLATLPACSDAGGRDDAVVSTPSSRTAAAEVAAAELVTGDCISGLVIGAAERTLVDTVRVVDCGSVHEVEVFATFDLSSADFEGAEPEAYPGEEGVVREADEGCAARLEEIDAGDAFGLIAIWPTDSSWSEGDRAVKCAVFARDGRPFDGRGLLAREER